MNGNFGWRKGGVRYHNEQKKTRRTLKAVATLFIESGHGPGWKPHSRRNLISNTRCLWRLPFLPLPCTISPRTFSLLLGKPHCPYSRQQPRKDAMLMVMKAGCVHTSLSSVRYQQQASHPQQLSPWSDTPQWRWQNHHGEQQRKGTRTGRGREKGELPGSSPRTVWFCKCQHHQSRNADFNLHCN